MSKLWNYVDGCEIGLADGIATSGAVALAFMLALWLGGCAQVGQIAAGDAQNAAALATAVGDSAGAACWPVLATTGNAIAATGNSVGCTDRDRRKACGADGAGRCRVSAGMGRGAGRAVEGDPGGAVRTVIPKPRFSPEINFGHIIQAAVLVLTVGGGACDQLHQLARRHRAAAGRSWSADRFARTAHRSG